MGRNRRHSRSSSSSSSSSSSNSDSDSSHKKHHTHSHNLPFIPSEFLPHMTGIKLPSPQPPSGRVSPRPPPYSRPPPSGYRIPLTTGAPFPPTQQALDAPCCDADGHSPVYVGSALFPNSVHPCKIAPHLHPTPCRVPYGGREWEHTGRFDLLPITPDMEWVPASGGVLPHGRRPVEGGYEEDGSKLYHAIAIVNDCRVPGKAGVHLGGANVAFGMQETYCREYEILCWRN